MMESSWLPMDFLLGLAVLGCVTALTIVEKLWREVDRAAKASERREAELVEYLRQAQIIFDEYFVKKQKENA
jgi:hypothetical protein